MTEFSNPAHAATAASPAQTIALATELASYARAAHDAVAMLEAARTLRTVPHDQFRAGMASPATLFAEARIIAGSDREMLAEIDWVQNDQPRTVRVVGGRYASDTWAVRHGGDGRGLKPIVSTLPPLRNAATIWGGVVQATIQAS